MRKFSQWIFKDENLSTFLVLIKFSDVSPLSLQFNKTSFKSNFSIEFLYMHGIDSMKNFSSHKLLCESIRIESRKCSYWRIDGNSFKSNFILTPHVPAGIQNCLICSSVECKFLWLWMWNNGAASEETEKKMLALSL